MEDEYGAEEAAREIVRLFVADLDQITLDEESRENLVYLLVEKIGLDGVVPSKDECAQLYAGTSMGFPNVSALLGGVYGEDL